MNIYFKGGGEVVESIIMEVIKEIIERIIFNAGIVALAVVGALLIWL